MCPGRLLYPCKLFPLSPFPKQIVPSFLLFLYMLILLSKISGYDDSSDLPDPIELCKFSHKIRRFDVAIYSRFNAKYSLKGTGYGLKPSKSHPLRWYNRSSQSLSVIVSTLFFCSYLFCRRLL